MNFNEIPISRIYDDLVWLMPMICSPEEYAEEAAHWRSELRKHLGAGRHHLLEFGIGSGYNLSHLRDEFDATAVDISGKMLEHCAALNPGIELHVGDMRNVRMDRKFDAVLIHDAISYMLSEEDLLATFRTAAAHLRAGGVFITSPDRFSESFREAEVVHFTRKKGDVELTTIEYTFDADPTDATVETLMTFLIRQGDALRIEHDRHVTGLFPRDIWLGLLNVAGFSAECREYSLSTLQRPYELLVGRLEMYKNDVADRGMRNNES